MATTQHEETKLDLLGNVSNLPNFIIEFALTPSLEIAQDTKSRGWEAVLADKRAIGYSPLEAVSLLYLRVHEK